MLLYTWIFQPGLHNYSLIDTNPVYYSDTSHTPPWVDNRVVMSSSFFTEYVRKLCVQHQVSCQRQSIIRHRPAERTSSKSRRRASGFAGGTGVSPPRSGCPTPYTRE
jgi:hypothetical protein